jgi:hypothetical protein
MIGGGFAVRTFAFVSALLVLSLGLAVGAESGPQWTVTPWIKDNTSNASLPHSTVSMSVLSGFNLSGQEPASVFLGKTMLPFREYSSRARTTELWLESGENWTYYNEVRQGDILKLIAYTPSGGVGDLYLIDYANGSISHSGYRLQPGYSNAILKADKTGRLMFVLAVENQPANALIIDVLPQIEEARGPKDIEQFSPGYALITITSDRIKGYDVYVDGVFYSSDTADGVLDGTASFKVGGDSVHTITVSKKGILDVPEYQSVHTKSFQSGYSYQLKI